jgi:8-oxo-dGTP pyrophosphatase MutT (NUDIX family)
VDLENYIKTWGEPVKEATLCLLFRDGKILLAMKKRGFGTGKYNGPGGKKNEGEDIETAAIRETEEEIGVKIENMEMMGVIDFYFAHKPDWNQKVSVFRVNKWVGEPTESEEMKPEWFAVSAIPYTTMWPDDIFWLPKVLEGKSVKAKFSFAEGDIIVSQEVITV